mgnify:CR=1 FL=1
MPAFNFPAGPTRYQIDDQGQYKVDPFSGEQIVDTTGPKYDPATGYRLRQQYNQPMGDTPGGVGEQIEYIRGPNGNAWAIKADGTSVDTGQTFNDVKSPGWWSLKNPLVTFAGLIAGGGALNGGFIFAKEPSSA